MYGWIGKIIRINLTNETISVEDLNPKDARLYVGGRGLGTKLYRNEVDPKVDPVSPQNNLLFVTGPLTGTLASCAGRYEAVTKSPLTGAIESCSLGGNFGPELKFAGYDGIIFEGKAKKPVYLYINDDRIEFREASRIWDMNVPAATDELKKETDEDAKIACIGTADEKPDLFSVIRNGKNRVPENFGFCDVMGFKNLKAVAVRGTKSIRVARRKEFFNICLKTRKKMKDYPVTFDGLPTYENPEFSRPVKNQAAEDKAAALKTDKALTAVAESIGICFFIKFAFGLSEITEMLRTCTGIDYTDEEVLQIGERIGELESVLV